MKHPIQPLELDEEGSELPYVSDKTYEAAEKMSKKLERRSK